MLCLLYGTWEHACPIDVSLVNCFVHSLHPSKTIEDVCDVLRGEYDTDVKFVILNFGFYR